MIFKIIYIITYLFGMFYIKNFMSAFLGTARTSKVLCRLSYLSYPIIVCTLYFTLNVPMLNLIANLSALFIISLNYDVSMMKRISCSAFLYLFMLLVEVGTAIATGYLGVSVLKHGTYSEPLGLIIVAMILYTASLIVNKVRKNKLSGKVKFEEWITIILIPILSLYLIIVLVESQETLQLKAVLTVATVFAINIIVFHLYDNLLSSYNNKINSIIFEQEKEYYYNQCKYMEASSESTRAFRHDIKNHLLTISDFIKSNKCKQAEEYIYTIVGEKLENQNTFSDTGNIAIDSVINFKLNEALSKYIMIDADIDVPDNLLLEPSDITAVVGNLIDNAITATQNLERAERKIFVNIYYDKGRMFINIENTFDGKLIKKNGKLETRKFDKEYHGYGLKNVQKIMEKYNGYIAYDNNDRIFKVTAIMYIKAAVAV